jgi:hypothetical protein
MTPWIFEESKRGGKQAKEYLVNYTSYMNNILVKVKLMELIELKVDILGKLNGNGTNISNWICGTIW